FKLYGRQGVPFLGVNMGTVGFLSGVHVNKLEENIERILKGDYYIKEKMMMEIKVLNEQGQLRVLEAFNEAVIKSKSVRLSSLLMWINDNEMGNLRGDGIIIATQTGSTGYSLSAGGPIVDPDLEAFVLTPLSSYYLNQRPLVVAADKIITFKLTQGQDNILCLDGQIEVELFPEDQVQITIASSKLKILNLEKDNFWNKIYDKLGRKFNG
ncbi:MAG: NAD(+)/NADH kinase, partial [Syntrophomonadaceae bacterium]|nr:NAD(+)/NADH kinase [Syntrophomonadaceae bacterium]